jgi:hypothetical protein
MAIQQATTAQFLLQGDGTSTVFTYAWNKLFQLSVSAEPEAPGFAAQVINSNTLPTSVSLLQQDNNLPVCTPSLDSFGNLVLTFASAIGNGVQGNVIVNVFFNSGTLAGISTSWTSSTAVNTTETLTLYGAVTVLVPITITGTVSGGVLSFYASADNTNWELIEGTTSSSFQPIASWTLASGNTAITFNVPGYAYFQVKLTTAISGTGSVGLIVQGSLVPANNLIVSGGVATYSSTAPTPTSGSGVPIQSDAYGSTFIKPYRRSQTAVGFGTFTSATATTLLAAQAAGVYADLGSITLTFGEGATANVYYSVTLSDGTNSYKFNAFSFDVTTAAPLAPVSVNFDPPIPATNAATAWTIALSSATDTPTVDVIATFVLQKAS